LKYRLHRQKNLDAAALETLRDILPEIHEAGYGIDLVFSDTEFNRDVPFKDLEKLRHDIADEQIPVTCHLPYVDLRFGSRDAKMHEYARDSLQEGLEMAAVLRCQVASLHLGYSNHIPPKRKEGWRDRVIESLQEMVLTAAEEEIVLAIENTYEPDGELLLEILEGVNSPYLRFCADLGHAACYSRMAPEEWIDAFKKHIVLLHFHDNDGLDDLHTACGDGVVGYEPVFELCKSAELSCPIVLEVGAEEWDQSIEHLKEIGFEFGDVPEPAV